MKKQQQYLSLLAAVLAAALPAVAQADSIDFTSFAAQPATVDLNAGTLAWAYYADSEYVGGSYATGINPAPTTDPLNLGDFTAFTTNVGSDAPATNPNGSTAVSYTGGVGGDNPAIVTGLTDYDQIQYAYNGASFSITSTLFAPTETFNLYLVDYSAASDLTASLNDMAGTTASLTNQVLSGTDPSGGTATVLTLTVTGQVGNVLTFTDAVDDTDPGTGNDGGITGIEAATIVAVPEPSTYAMLFAGVGLLVLVRRFRSKAV